MGYKKGDDVVCVVDTNKSLKQDKVYTVNNVNGDGFISLSGVYDKNRNYKYFNPVKHFKSLTHVRKNKLNRLI